MAERYYVYAIIEADIRLPDDIVGFGGPLRVMTYGGLGAVVSQIGADEAPAGVRDARPAFLLRHEAVVEAVHAVSRALPVRFGTILASAEAVTHALAQGYDVLLHDLQRIGDGIEVGVSALWRSSNDSEGATAAPALPDESDRRPETAALAQHAARPGVAYMQARQGELRRTESAQARAQALASELDTAICPHARAWRHSVETAGPSGRSALRALYLLDRERLHACEQAFQRVRRRHPEASLLLSGPWPPYSFVASSLAKGKDSL